MSQQIIAFIGISGVGKTTFLRNMAGVLQFQHLTGGSLIAAARQVRQESRDAMRDADLDENQRLLIAGFALARDRKASHVIMDGHAVIEANTGLQKLPTEVFRALGITKMVHLEDEPSRIRANRSNDMSRHRPSYDLKTLTQHQDTSRSHAKTIAAELNVEFLAVKNDSFSRLASLLSLPVK